MNTFERIYYHFRGLKYLRCTEGKLIVVVFLLVQMFNGLL